MPFTGGGGEATLAALGGRVDGTCGYAPGMKGQIDAGKLRVLAVFQQGKYDLLPDAKPIGETPWKDTFPVGYYVIAPKGLPKPVLDKLMAASKIIVESDEFKSFLKTNGYTLGSQIRRRHEEGARRTTTASSAPSSSSWTTTSDAGRQLRLPPARRIVGVLALLLAAVYAVDAWQTLSIGRWHKPGAAIFPIARRPAAGDLGDLGAAGAARRRQRSDAATFALPAGADLRRLLLVMAAFALYFVAMPLLGNMIASALFLLASDVAALGRPRQIGRCGCALYAVVMAVDVRGVLRATAARCRCRRGC